jgi:hypothetical protein
MKPGRRDKYLKRLEPVKGIEPSYSAFGKRATFARPECSQDMHPGESRNQRETALCAQGGIGKRQ